MSSLRNATMWNQSWWTNFIIYRSGAAQTQKNLVGYDALTKMTTPPESTAMYGLDLRCVWKPLLIITTPWLSASLREGGSARKRRLRMAVLITQAATTWTSH